MKKIPLVMLAMSAMIVFAGSFGVQKAGAQTNKAAAVQHIEITGEIAKADYGYIIRGKVPAEVFSILNPNPDVLDKLIKSGKTVRISASIVLGDNVEIKKIDGKKYRGKPAPGK